MARHAFPALITLTIVALLLSAFPRSQADRRVGCLWDRDTLRHEARDMPEVIAAITGRFDRFPPLYYEMRLDRVTAEIGEDPARLDLYDDAAVACDRLGRHDDAIAWMTLKGDWLAIQPDPEHRYRYLANLGTFHAHRWISNGTDRSDTSDLEAADQLIAEAIQLNPDAHFGRERYQLLAIRWLLEPPPAAGVIPSIFEADLQVAGLLGHPVSDRRSLADAGYTDAAEGLAGLIILGNAWNSPDVMAALRTALLARGDASVAYLAFLRLEELLAEGRASLHPESELPFTSHPSPFLERTAHLDEYFEKARAEATAWQESRNEHMLAALQRGRHPDTDADFWADWRPVSDPPAMPGVALSHDATTVITATLLTIGALTVIAIGVTRIRSRRRKAHAQPVG